MTIKKICVMMWVILLSHMACAQDSLGMRRESELVYWPMTGQIQVVRNLAYIYGGTSGVHIVNIADPAHPQELSRFTWDQWYDPTGGWFYVSGDRAYIGFSDETGGLVFDVSDSTRPRQIGWWNNELNGVGYVHEDWAVGFSSAGYPFVLDVSDPTNVHQIANFPAEVCGDNITAAGTLDGHLCLTGSLTGLYVFDMSNPAQPVRVAAVDTTLSATMHCVVSGNYAYLATVENGVRIIDLTNPLAPVDVAVCAGSCEDVAIAGTHACVLTEDSVRLWDVADPAHPLLAGSFPLPGRSTIMHGVIAGTGTSVLVSLWSRNPAAVVIEDISDPAAPRQVSSIGVHGKLGRFAVAGDTAYVVDSRLGMRTFNLGDSQHPLEMGQAPCGVYPVAVDVGVYSHYAYVVESDENWPPGGGLFIFDISNAAQPDSLNLLPPRGLQRIVIHGNYGYSFDHQYLRALSLAVPAAPQVVDSVEILDTPELCGIAFAGDYLYFGYAEFPYQITIFNVASPGHPAWAGHTLPFALTEAAVGMAVTGHYLFVADRWGGLVTLDITNPEQPTVAGQLSQGDAQKVALSGTTLIVKWQDRLSVLDVTDPLNPSEMGYYDNPEWLEDMKLVGPCLYTSSEANFRAYQVDALLQAAPHSALTYDFTLYPAYPNPFNPTTVIRFSLPQTQKAKLTIFDITGRAVKTLTDDVLSTGDHRVTFDGAALSSGVYFARLEAGKKIQVEKIMLLK
jgi:hypothetical protein